MKPTNTATGEFEAAIKNFSKISLEVDSLADLGNTDANKIMSKSIESRKRAISHEASRRLSSFDVEQKGTKSKESLQTHGTLEKLFLAEVELEFDKGVTEQKMKLRGDSQIYEKKVENDVETKTTKEAEKKKSESSIEESAESDDTENEDSENESSGDESTDDADKDLSEEGEDEDSSENESTDDESDAEKVDDSGKK